MQSIPLKMKLISAIKNMPNETKILVAIFILASILNIVISFFVELWPLGTDPIVHYKQSLAMLDGEVPPNRTFLYNGLLAIFLYFNQDYWVAQVVNAFISTLFIIPLYYIAKEQINKKVALQSIILVSLIPFTIFGIATTPKLLAVFFILSVYYFALENKFNTWFLVLSVLAFLTHQLTLFFIFPAFLLMFRKNRKKFLIFSFILGIVILSWIFFIGGESKFIYYPFAVKGWGSTNVVNESFWQDFYSTPWYKLIGIRVVNFFIPITPLLFPTIKIINTFYPIALQLHKVIDLSVQPWAYHYLQSYSGGLGILLFSFAFINIWKRKKSRLVFLIVVPYIISVITAGHIYSVASVTGLALYPLLLVAALSEIEKRDSRKKWLAIIVITLMVELFLMFVTFGDFINFTKENLTQSGTIVEYNKLNSLYRLKNEIFQ